MKYYLVFLLAVFSGCDAVNVDLGKSYKLVPSTYGGDFNIIKGENIIVVSGNVLQYSFNSNFIIAIQKPRDSFDARKFNNYNDYKKAFEKSNYSMHWIINKRTDSIYGPLVKARFDSLSKEFMINPKIKFKYTEDFKKIF